MTRRLLRGSQSSHVPSSPCLKLHFSTRECGGDATELLDAAASPLTDVTEREAVCSGRSARERMR